MTMPFLPKSKRVQFLLAVGIGQLPYVVTEAWPLIAARHVETP